MIKRVKLENFRRHADTEIVLDPNDQIVAVAGTNGSGKCLPGEVRLHDADTGEAVRIDDVVRQRRRRVLGVVNGKVVPVTVTDWHTVGPKGLVSVTLSNGATLRTAATHPVLTDRGCVRAGELAPGDWVAEARCLPAAGPARISVDEALIIGLLLGDGTVTQSVSLTAGDADVVALFTQAVERAFPNLTVRRQGNSLMYRVVSAWDRTQRHEALVELHRHLTDAGVPLSSYLHGTSQFRFARGESGMSYETFCEIETDFGLDLSEYRHGLYGGRVFHEWVRELGLLGHDSYTKFIPANLLHQPEAQVRALIAGLWQTDGWFSGGVAAYGTQSVRLAADVRLVLLRLGILASVRQHKTSGSWRISVSVAGTTRFDRIDLVGDKAANRDRVLARIAARTSNANSDLIPPSQCANLANYSASGRRRSNVQLARHAMTREVFADFGGDPAVLAAELTWARVEQVVDAGSAECFDITVDTDEHLYLAETFVVHNSTLLESLQFALYGQGRQGARNLDALVRRGAEHEGMGVEATFTVGDDDYTVVRRRDAKHVSAVLYANDHPLVEGPKAVTAAVTQLLGLDAAGFRLAAVAQQKELDALIRLGGPQRVRALGRLLRLDAVGRAREQAKSRHRRVIDVLSGIPTPADLAELVSDLAAAEADLAAAEATEAACRAAIADIESSLARTADIDERYQRARSAAAAATATAAAAEQELARVEAALAALRIPDEVAKPAVQAGLLASEANQVERQIAQAEAASQVNAQRSMLERELVTVTERLNQIDARLLRRPPADVVAAATQADADLAKFRAEAVAAHERAEQCRGALIEARAAATAARNRLQAVTTLGALCETCGQDIPVDHRHDAVDVAKAAYDSAAAAETGATASVTASRIAAEEAEAAVEHASGDVHRLETEVRDTVSLEGEAAELVRRRDVYQSQLERLVVVPVDLDGLYSRKAELALHSVAVRSAERAEMERNAALARHSELNTEVVAARARVDQQRAAAAHAAISEGLADAWDERRRQIDAHRHELELLGELTAAAADARAGVDRCSDAVERNRQLAAARGDRQEEGTVAALTVRVLSDLEERLGCSVRPALEGSASDLLTKMSDGRFSSIRLSADYLPSVLDDGSYRPLGELSGGEQDLVALALRLAVSDVVAERQGGALGFLILDEILGSQDGQRRDSILACLRGLRSRYGQIWCISHVGGLEDIADRVIEIETGDDGIARVV
jgi:DNA repair protein SbcC/Rad50